MIAAKPAPSASLSVAIHTVVPDARRQALGGRLDQALLEGIHGTPEARVADILVGVLAARGGAESSAAAGGVAGTRGGSGTSWGAVGASSLGRGWTGGSVGTGAGAGASGVLTGTRGASLRSFARSRASRTAARAIRSTWCTSLNACRSIFSRPTSIARVSASRVRSSATKDSKCLRWSAVLRRRDTQAWVFPSMPVTLRLAPELDQANNGRGLFQDGKGLPVDVLDQLHRQALLGGEFADDHGDRR
jgi:hypothetical protein